MRGSLSQTPESHGCWGYCPCGYACGGGRVGMGCCPRIGAPIAGGREARIGRVAGRLDCAPHQMMTEDTCSIPSEVDDMMVQP